MSGNFEMIKINSGDRITIQMDGTELRDQVPVPRLEWCDKGAHYVDAAYGKDVYGMLWQCDSCSQRKPRL